MLTFLFPSDYFNPKKIDEAYLAQAVCLQNAGFSTVAISLESLGANSSKIIPAIVPDSKVVYRGWMLSPFNYELLINAIANVSAVAFTCKSEYLATHYLPNWYLLITDLTPETKFYSVDSDLESELTNLGWQCFFIKDYVKSLKTSSGSIIEKPSDIKAVVSEMQKFRGTIEGGICVRKVEDFISDFEQRYFVINGRSFAANSDEKVPSIVEECAKRISSKFFSVDVVKRRDGVERIVEIGDGQVSDLVGWTAERFAELWLGEC